jgi:hypothetical protein
MEVAMRRFGGFLAALLFVPLVLATAVRPAAAMPVDLELVLSVDVSRSIDAWEFDLQRQGYANAFRDDRVLEAIASGALQRIAVTLIEWSGVTEQAVVIDWMTIGNVEDADAFARALESASRSFAGRTSISTGIDAAMEQFAKSPHQGRRRVIDVSGDGINNSGRPVTDARDQAVAKGVVINGLAIINDRPNPIPYWRGEPEPPLDQYYMDNVLGGPGAFLIVARDFPDFGRAIIAKLLREIALNPGGGGAATGRPDVSPAPAMPHG